MGSARFSIASVKRLALDDLIQPGFNLLYHRAFSTMTDGEQSRGTESKRDCLRKMVATSQNTMEKFSLSQESLTGDEVLLTKLTADKFTGIHFQAAMWI
jgi:hypothetical protein